MTIRELAINLIENDSTSDRHLLTLEEAATIVGDLLADDDDGDLPHDLTPEAFRDAFNDELMMDVDFYGGESRRGAGIVNYMTCRQDRDLYAEIPFPDGARECFGYGLLKADILIQAKEAGYDPDLLRFWYGPSCEEPCEISIDNGRSVCSPAEAVERMPWDVIVADMDDDAREETHREGIDDNVQFLTRYLEIAPYDLIIG